MSWEILLKKKGYEKRRPYIPKEKNIRNQMRNVYHNELIPELQRVNPGQHILLANEPSSASRERMYRGQGMGRADPSGMQYSIVGPERGAQAQPFEPFGGQLPDIYQDEVESRQRRREGREFRRHPEAYNVDEIEAGWERYQRANPS